MRQGASHASTAIDASSIDDGNSAMRATTTGESIRATTDTAHATEQSIAAGDVSHTSNIHRTGKDRASHVRQACVKRASRLDTGNTLSNNMRDLPIRATNTLEPMCISSTTRKKIKSAARTVVKDGILKAIMGVRDVGVISVGCSSLDGFGTAARAFGIPFWGVREEVCSQVTA